MNKMWALTKNKSWQDLQVFSWIRDMKDVPQSPVHHAEGNVDIHTQMVLKELLNLSEYQELPMQQQEILWAAALLHDVEKRSCTKIDEEGKIVSPNHAKKGAMTTRQILYREIETPFEIREMIVGLVRYHGLPLWVFEKPDPVKAVILASLEVDTNLLAILAKADILGRICEDANEMLYRIEIFKELCIEHACFGKQKKFTSNLSRFKYFQKMDQQPTFDAFDDTKTEVIVLSGIAGSGKDYYLKTTYPHHKVVSLDDLRRSKKIDYNDSKGNGRVIQEAKEMAKECMRKQISFVWNATNITRQMREQLIDLCLVYSAKITIVYLEVPYRKLLQQNSNREHPIPAIAIERMINKLEIPQVWEAHEVVIIN
jgi:putative nucleotidyltransferase with HDIG domain